MKSSSFRGLIQGIILLVFKLFRKNMKKNVDLKIAPKLI